MDALVKPVEQALAPIFKDLPALSVGFKKGLVKYWPALALILGFVQLFRAITLWQAGHAVSDLSIAFGYTPYVHGLGFIYYTGLAVLVVNGFIFLNAYRSLKIHAKKGWDLLFLGVIINLVYGVVIAFDSYYGGLGNLVLSLVSSAIGFYFLFQVREYYTGAKSTQ